MRFLQRETYHPEEVTCMDAADTDYFDDLENDLRHKKDRAADLDDLFQYSFLGEDDVRERASWCVAKMGQNKVPDSRILDILYSMTGDDDPQVRENVAWGIGEVAGAGIGDERSIDSVTRLMKDQENTVRGMAVWAAGRLRHKLSLENEAMLDIARSLLDDVSPLVRKSAEYVFE